MRSAAAERIVREPMLTSLSATKIAFDKADLSPFYLAPDGRFLNCGSSLRSTLSTTAPALP
jgi:hypothetical protein